MTTSGQPSPGSWGDDNDEMDFPAAGNFVAAAAARAAAAPMARSVSDPTPASSSSHGGARPPRGDRPDRPPREEREPLPVPTEPPFKAYIKNLSFKAQEEDLRFFFNGLTIVDVIIPQDRETGRPKGSAYVEFQTAGDLKNALTASGDRLMDRNVEILVAEPRRVDDRGGRGGRGGAGSGSGSRGYGFGARGGSRDDFSHNFAGNGGDGAPSSVRRPYAPKPQAEPAAAAGPIKLAALGSAPQPKTNKSNPFGAARPREEVLKERPVDAAPAPEPVVKV
jgi:RNA recognition motif-containing protein